MLKLKELAEEIPTDDAEKQPRYLPQELLGQRRRQTLSRRLHLLHCSPESGLCGDEGTVLSDADFKVAWPQCRCELILVPPQHREEVVLSKSPQLRHEIDEECKLLVLTGQSLPVCVRHQDERMHYVKAINQEHSTALCTGLELPLLHIRSKDREQCTNLTDQLVKISGGLHPPLLHGGDHFRHQSPEALHKSMHRGRHAHFWEAQQARIVLQGAP
mmetsp:Transcript_118046/g.252163  ORF Transcript_118046/g.252163 Transcript_118046/m.252163 type:complete len:216 (-) Transcript_118046:1602-2249(-)